jgi:hypothetical protein
MQIAIWFWVLGLVCLVLVAMAVLAKRAGSQHGWRLVALAALACGLLPQALQRSDTAHLSWVSCVPFGLMPVFIAETVRRRGTSVPKLVGHVVILVPFALMLLFPHYTYRWYADYVVQSSGNKREVSSIDHRGRSFYYGRADVATAAEEMLDDVEQVTEPGDTVIVGTGDLRRTPYSEAYLYFLLPQLDPGTKYIEMDPGVADAPDSGLADEMRETDIVILSTVYDDWDEPNASMDLGSDEPNQVLADDFRQYASYGSNGPARPVFELYVRRDTGTGPP